MAVAQAGRDAGAAWRRGAAVLGAGLIGGAAWKLADDARRKKPILDGRTIAILGAGFGGTQAALELAKLLPMKDDGRILLIDENNYLVFTPMLTEVAGGQVNPRHIVCALRQLSPRVTFLQGRVDAVDAKAKKVTLTLGSREDGIPEAQKSVEADELVIALGSVTNYHDLPGIAEHSFTIKRLGDAATICNRVVALLERADAEPDAEKRRDLLTFVVGGGGFSGVETMASVNDYVRDAAKHYPNVKAGEIRTLLIDPTDRLLQELDADLAGYARKELEARGVEVALKTRITGAGEGYVDTEEKGRIPTQLLIWTGGVSPGSLARGIDCEHSSWGGIVVDDGFAVKDRPGIWAIGDCAQILQLGSSKPYAPTAQNATREGAHVAKNIVAKLKGQAPRPFTFRPFAELAMVGKQAGVARVFGVKFSGFPAWAMWRTVYLAKMPGGANRARIGIDWLLDLVFGRPITELPVSRLQGRGR